MAAGRPFFPRPGPVPIQTIDEYGLIVGSGPTRPRWRRRAAPRTAFVLSGGGNRGAVQVGMLRELMARQIKPDLILGASVGALNGTAVAADPTPGGIERLAATWTALRDETIFPHHHYGGWRFIQHRDAVYPSDALRELIEAFLPFRALEDAMVPVEVVATSLSSGQEHWFSEGPAVDALLASCAIPGVFPPVRLNGDRLVDGGVLDDVPFSRALDAGVQRVFVLLCGPLEADSTPATRPVDALLNAFAVAIRGRFVRELEQIRSGVQVVVIAARVPHLSGYWDFSRTPELIAAGQFGAQKVLDQLTGMP